ncbi:phosphoglycerate mutase (2,3-diphosphoglycerate-independent) [Ranunculus cassubicifolius]
MATCLVSNESSISPMVAIDCVIEERVPDIPRDVAEIVVVHHGETSWNAAGLIQGQLESPLNEVGLKQAVAFLNFRFIVERLAKEQKPAALYSSDLSRAKDTAEMIAKKWHIPEVIIVPKLKERHVGSLQGLVWGEIQEKEPETYHAFFSSQSDLEIPVRERVIVVMHGGVLRAIYMSVTREPSAGKIMNGSVNVLHLSEKKWAFNSWSDVTHLNEVGFLQRGFNGDALQH